MKETPKTECSYEIARKGARWKATICCSLSCSNPTLTGCPFLFLFVLRAVSACANNSLKCFSWLLNFRRQLTFCKEKRGFTLLNHSLPPRRLRSHVFCLLLVILLRSDGVIKLVQEIVCLRRRGRHWHPSSAPFLLFCCSLSLCSSVVKVFDSRLSL